MPCVFRGCGCPQTTKEGVKCAVIGSYEPLPCILETEFRSTRRSEVLLLAEPGLRIAIINIHKLSGI